MGEKGVPRESGRALQEAVVVTFGFKAYSR